MADNLTPPQAGSKVQPKKETVRISLPPKPMAKETVRLELPPRTAAAAPVAPAAPKPLAPTAPPVASVAKQTVRLSMPPKPSVAKETVRLEMPPRTAGVPKAAASGGKEIKLLVPQVDETAASATIPDTNEAEMPTLDSSAPPMAAAKPAGGLKGGPPGSKPAAASAGPTPVRSAGAPASALPDSTPSAMALPAKKGAPKPEFAAASFAGGGVVIRKAGWPDYTLSILALLTGLAAVGRLFMLLSGN